ncbi:MAG: peptidase U32, partial [Coriobacteriaceae bacterium]|nr:peptidase U32 [Coriobacteriaceae bacterium]
MLVAAEEMPGALRMIDAAWIAGIDAVIIQDLGLMRLVRKALPHVRIHASTQLDAHNTASVRVLAELGAARVTLARETCVDEIASFVADGAAEIESFVHGSLCFCYSGQCLLSSLIGGRSANRGLCAQPCRMAYTLVAESGEQAGAPGPYLLSPKDLAGLDLLSALVRAGVSALKIEGRMKAPEYVALVTGVYRAALDRATLDPESFASAEAEWSVLAEAFSRGFTPAYLAGVRDDAMMSYSRPNNRGVHVGRVADSTGETATVLLERSLEPEDTLEFWTGRGRFAQRAGAMEVAGSPVPVAPAGAKVLLRTESRVSPGDRVFRVACASLIEAARRTFAAETDIAIDLSVRLRVGEPVLVTARAAGAEGTATGPVVEAARTKALGATEVIEHVGRTGGSGFVPASWDIDLDPTAGAGYSTLHRVRREALEALAASMLAPWADRVLSDPVVSASEVRRGAGQRAPELVVSGRDPAVLAACLAAGADRGLLHVGAAELPGTLPEGVEPLIPRVAHDDEAAALLGLAERCGRAVAGNLGLLTEAARAGVRVEADWPLGAFNPWSCAALSDLGASLVWASPELSGRQLRALVAASAVPVGTLVYGRTELMIAEHCVLQAAGPCSHECATCARR